MAAIDVDFEVFKELTARRASETVTYNDVIRDLLGLNKKLVPRVAAINMKPAGTMFDGVLFQNGSQFRKVYKGTLYTGEIKDGAFVLGNGKRCSSPSDAARKITGNNVNGWRFWECKRPGDANFRLLEGLRPVERLA